MTYRITDIKVRSLLSLNQKPSLCIVTMILSVYFCAINWKVSLRVFLLRNFVCPAKFLITLFSKWYKDIRRKIVPVQVLGAPSTESEMPESPSLIPEQKPESAPRLSSPAELRILVDIRMSNGVHISQKNLSYEGLKSLVEKLEVLC